MEPYQGRRGKESGGVCGMNRAHQTMLLMVAMVATMAVVLLWEASPFVVSGVAQSPVLKVPVSAYEELANSYESRPFLRNHPAAERTNEGSADLTESDVAPTAEEIEQLDPEIILLEASPTVVEDEPKPKSSDTVSEEIKNEASVVKESISTANETLAELEEETSLAEEEKDLTLAGKETKNATVSESTLTAEEKSELSLETEETTAKDPRPRNSTTAMEDEADAEAIAQEMGFKAVNSTTAMESEDEGDAEAISQEMGSKATMNAITALEDEAEGEVDAEAIAQEMGSKVRNSTTAMEDEAEGEIDAEAITQAKVVNSTTAMEDEAEGEIDAEAITQAKVVNSTTAMEDETEGDAEEIAQETAESEEEDRLGEQKRECDYSVGKWVVDETHPLYSGLECKMWLSPGFSCRLNNHPDKLLDRYRWQPAACDLPVFNASAVLEMLRNKVVAFVGDSLGRQQLQSLLCMLTRGKDETAITDIGTSFGFFTPRGERKPNGFAFRFDATNTTIMYKWSVTLARIQPLLNGTNALHLDRPEEFIESHLPVIDVLVLNTGHHWNNGKMKQNKFDYYLDGKPVKLSVPVANNVTVHNVVKWMHNATIATPEKIVFYRSLSPRHFRNGDWNTGGTCDTITFGKDKQLQEGMRVDPNAESAVIGTTVNLLNITSLSLERGETHVSKYGGGTGGQDCLHWCLPGIPDTWNEIFFAELATKLKRRGVGYSNRSK